MLLYQALAVMGNLGSLDSTSEDDSLSSGSLSGDSLSDSGKGSKDNSEGTTENTEKQETKTKAQTDTQTTAKDTKATTATQGTNTQTNTNTRTATNTQTNTDATKETTKERGTTKTDDLQKTTSAKGSAKYNQWGFTGDQSVWKAPTTLASGLSGSASKSTHSVHGNKTSNANMLHFSDSHQYSWKSKFLIGSLVGSVLVLNTL